MLVTSAYVWYLFFLQPILFDINHVGNFRNEFIAFKEVYNEISRFHQTFLICVLRMFK
jgi:hypothetical protein